MLVAWSSKPTFILFSDPEIEKVKTGNLLEYFLHSLSGVLLWTFTMREKKIIHTAVNC